MVAHLYFAGARLMNVWQEAVPVSVAIRRSYETLDFGRSIAHLRKLGDGQHARGYNMAIATHRP